MMNPDWLLKHFEQISEAPDAVPRIRRFVLDLAVRGKLVEQDPADEPASELLKRIEAEKAHLYKEKGLHKPKRTPVQKDEGFPCEIPAMWKWCNLAEISLKIHYGYTASANPRLQEIRLLRITDIQNNSVHWDSVPGCEIAHEQADQYLLADGDILIARTGGTIGKSFLVKDIPVKAVFASYLIRIRGSQNLFDRYLKLFLESPVYWTQLENGSRGAGQPNVNGQTLGNMVVSVPPLAEQHRIVAKVDELMALCDELEAARAKRERRRDRLVAATLHGLNNGDVGRETGVRSTFKESARFYFNHLPCLTTRPEHIRQLRQTILNLAVRGKLVPRIASEGTAESVIEEINATRKKLLADGKVGRHLPLGPVNKDETPFAIPPAWRWVCFGDITFCRDGERIPVSREERQYRQGPFDYYGASGIIDKIDGFLFDKPLLLIGEDGANLINRSTPIAFIARGRFWVNNHAHVLDGISEGFLRYVELFINATDLKPYITGTAQPKMNQAKMNSIPVALPPLTEQNRIVEKVDELMALCDGLETRLTTLAATRHQLLEATLSEAIAS